VSLDYRHADQPPLALIEDPSQMEESSSASPPPNPDLPDDHWRYGGRGKDKRPPPQSASRQPLKYAKSDEPLIPLPPNANGAPEPAPTTKTSSRPKLTPGEAGVPLYKGDEYQPLTRLECKSYYSIRQWNQIPKAGVPISDKELIRALKKIPDEGNPHINGTDREMSEFVMDRMDQCLTIPEGFVYEVMINGNKRYKTIYGDTVSPKVAFASTGLYRLLDLKMIARVGDYYFSLRMRPEKKASTYEYT
jgi:hypothetical protein